MTTKQYTREELDQYANGAHRSISEHKSRAMLRQCLARINQLEAEPSDKELDAVTAVLKKEDITFGPHTGPYATAVFVLDEFLKSRRG